MKQRIAHSILFSLEWRAYAFVITNLFLWLTGSDLWHATLTALGLQVILLVAHGVWYFFRGEKGTSHEATV